MLRAIGGDFIVGSEFVRRICTSIGVRRIGGGGLIISARGGEGIFGGSGASRIGGGAFGRGTWSRPAFGGAFFGNDWRRFSTSWWWRTSLGEHGAVAVGAVAVGICNAVVASWDRPARFSVDPEACHRNHNTSHALDPCDISPPIENGPQC